MRDKISPEEKLLKLIRNQPRQPVANNKEMAVTNALPAVKPNLLSLFYSMRNEHNIDKAILIIFICSCLYLGAAILYPFVSLRKIRLPKVSENIIIEPKLSQKEEIKPFEFYQKAAQGRQLFANTASQATQASVSLNADLVKDINLVGVISGDAPQAIIEDKKAQKTYYLNKGQFLGEFQVEDIQEGKIILNHQGERFELYL